MPTSPPPLSPEDEPVYLGGFGMQDPRWILAAMREAGIPYETMGHGRRGDGDPDRPSRLLVRKRDVERTLEIFERFGVQHELVRAGSPLLDTFDRYTRSLPGLGRLETGPRMLVTAAALLLITTGVCVVIGLVHR